MRLTVRQIDLITYLLNCGDWRTGDQLSEEFGLSRKTIQAEIKAISDSPVIGPEIEINPRRGYRLSRLTEESQIMLRETIRFYGDTRNSVGVRPASLVLYLLFQNDSVSMQHLADAFFFSKTAISLEMETVRRWIARQPDLELEVSGVRGIRLWGTELRKRMYCVNHATRTAFGALPFPREIHERYIRYLDICRDILQRAVQEENMLLTGESMFQVSRFIAFSILRTEMGYILDFGELEGEQTLPIVSGISSRIKEELGLTLSEAEERSVSLMLRLGDRSPIVPTGPFPRELGDMLSRFEESICALLGLAPQALFRDRTGILTHLERVFLREEYHQIAVNHYNEDIIRHYPLATHITHRLLPECFGLEISKEASFLSLIVQEGLQKLGRRPSVLLVSNQNIPVIRQIESWLRGRGDVAVGKLESMPAYVFEAQPQAREEYDVLLTTQEEILIQHPEFYLIPPIMTAKEMDQLNFYIKELMSERAAKKRRSILERFLREETVDAPDPDIFSIIGCQDDGTLSFHLYSSIYLHVARLQPDGEPGIHIYHLKKPILFRGKRVRELIFTEFPQGSEDILSFDQTVSDILCSQA